ncbi:hypothetical protein [Marinomonas sp. 2405UD68-3]
MDNFSSSDMKAILHSKRANMYFMFDTVKSIALQDRVIKGQGQ